MQRHCVVAQDAPHRKTIRRNSTKKAPRSGLHLPWDGDLHAAFASLSCLAGRGGGGGRRQRLRRREAQRVNSRVAAHQLGLGALAWRQVQSALLACLHAAPQNSYFAHCPMDIFISSGCFAGRGGGRGGLRQRCLQAHHRPQSGAPAWLRAWRVSQVRHASAHACIPQQDQTVE